MSSKLLSNPNFVPVLSFDPHFANVPRLEEVRFDPVRCANLFSHPVIGIAEQDLSRIHVFVRPDYKLGYTREERRIIREADPEEYDTESASCKIIENTDLFGQKGDVLMTIVYGTHYGPNALLCHEAIHAREMLKRRNLIATLGQNVLANTFPKRGVYLDTLEEAEADWAMKNDLLKILRKGVIEIISAKKK